MKIYERQFPINTTGIEWDVQRLGKRDGEVFSTCTHLPALITIIPNFKRFQSGAKNTYRDGRLSDVTS